MMKTKLSLILGSLFLFSQAAMAVSTTYNVTASVPAGSGVSMAVNTVTGTTFTPVSGTTLTYGALQFNTTTKVFLAPNYFTIDVANIGAGSPNTTITYVAGTVPTGATSSLGSNSSIAFDKEVFTSSSTPPAETLISGPAILANVSGLNIPSASTAGGWLRMYMGICTGNTSTDPSGCTPFKSTDAVGAYKGQLTVSATTT